MQIKKGFKLRTVDDLYVVIAGPQAAQDFNGMITLNESGAFLWNKLQAPTTEEDLVAALCEEYGIISERAETDVRKFLQILRSGDLLDD